MQRFNLRRAARNGHRTLTTEVKSGGSDERDYQQ